ncbi:MAG: BrxA/BrxB family bacilliredoxin [Candidatus Eisenbacteria bacterium]|nr:BrxA/BrxB family bacilliredoxin [Candidatus Eisenbacteria bacterium]
MAVRWPGSRRHSRDRIYGVLGSGVPGILSAAPGIGARERRESGAIRPRHRLECAVRASRTIEVPGGVAPTPGKREEIVSRYPAEFTEPMRGEIQAMGVRELRTPEEVDAVLKPGTGTVLVFVNSVCGCAAGMARPGLALSMESPVKPDHVVTVFAGVDMEATAQARSYFEDYPPSSPQAALFKDGKVVELIQRHHIEGTSATAVRDKLVAAHEKYCAQ